MSEERERHELQQRLADAIGPDAAGTLMRQLPPFAWTEVATKRDLEQLEERLFLRVDAKFERSLRETENALRTDLHTQTRFLFFSTFGAVLTTAAVTLSGVSLLM